MPKIDIKAYNEAKAWEDMSEEERAAAKEHEEMIKIEAEALILTEGLSEEERADEVARYLSAAEKKYIKGLHVHYGTLSGFELKEAAPIYSAEKPTYLEPGFYMIDINESVENAVIYKLEVNNTSFKEFIDAIENGTFETEEIAPGHKVTTSDIEIKAEVWRVEREAGIPFLYVELLLFLALKDTSNQEEYSRLLSLFYTLRTPQEAPQQAGLIDALPELMQQDIEKPRHHLRPITKLAQNLANPQLFNDSGVQLTEAGTSEKRRGADVITAVSLSYEGEGLSIFRELTPIDRNIGDTLATLWAAGNRAVTTRQVYTALTGADTTNPSPEQLAKIEESIDLLRSTYARIDFTDQMRGRKGEFEGEEITNFEHEDYLISASKERIKTAKGTEAIGYVLKSAPLHYYHAQITGQIISYPQRLLTAMQEAGSNTDANINIKQYLLQRIAQIPSLSNKIKYSTIFDEAGLKDLDRTQRSRRIKYIKKCLDILKAEGHIKAYKEYKAGRAAEGIEITV